MYAPPATHPTDQTLHAYGLGKLEDFSADSVGKHLESCPACRRRVADLSSDSFLDQLRDAQAQPRFAVAGCLLTCWPVDDGQRHRHIGAAAG